MNGRKKYSKEELEQFIHKWIEENDRIPMQRDFLHNKEYPSNKQYRDMWGSWSNMILDLKLRDTKNPINKNTHICRTCGKEFKAYGQRAYCSHECRYKDKTKYESNSTTKNNSGYRK